MYCTIQEAYNIPSFDPLPRKKKCAPDAQAKASAVAYEAYRRDGGNGTGDFTMYKYAVPKQQCQGEEEPIIQGNKPLQRRIPYETFQDYSPKIEMNTEGRTTYAGREGDREQYCKMYGICASDQVENFINGASLDQVLTKNDVTTTSKKYGTCGAGSDFYEVPLSEETKRQFQSAMNTSLNQKTASTVHPSADAKLRYDDMNKVSGYYDDDLEQYLKNSEATKIPNRMPMNAEAKPEDVLHSPEKSPFGKTIKRFSEHSVQKPLKPENLRGENGNSASLILSRGMNHIEAGMISNYGWDLALFIIAGVLIIFLLDQLFKLAVMLGMRHTMELLEPYMKELKAMASK